MFIGWIPAFWWMRLYSNHWCAGYIRSVTEVDCWCHEVLIEGMRFTVYYLIDYSHQHHGWEWHSESCLQTLSPTLHNIQMKQITTKIYFGLYIMKQLACLLLTTFPCDRLVIINMDRSWDNRPLSINMKKMSHPYTYGMIMTKRLKLIVCISLFVFSVTQCLFIVVFRLFVVILSICGCFMSLCGYFTSLSGHLTSCGHFVPLF